MARLDLEAARIAARRGHRVTLLEAASELGGHEVLAAMTPWRHDLIVFTTWLGEALDQPRRRGPVESSYADCAGRRSGTILTYPDEWPTGGLPKGGQFEGSEHVTTTWDVLAGAAFLRRAGVAIR